MLLFALIAAPVFFFLLTWVVATVYRLYFPDEPAPFRRASVLRRGRWATERAMPVGVREIREAQRRHLREQVGAYHYAGPGSDGFPTDWVEDLWRRRN